MKSNKYKRIVNNLLVCYQHELSLLLLLIIIVNKRKYRYTHTYFEYLNTVQAQNKTSR